MNATPTLQGLTIAGCRQRQSSLARSLAERGIDAAMIADPRQIHAYTGFWTRSLFRSLFVLFADGRSLLAAPFLPDEPVASDAIAIFNASVKGTLVDDQILAATNAIAWQLRDIGRVGSDYFRTLPGGSILPADDIRPLLRSQRRCKLADEIAIIERGIRACESAYARAKQIIRPGVTEWAIYRQVMDAALESVGEPIGELGNDFQSGTPGGAPRHRAMLAGELLPLDLSVVVRGYTADLCRTFCVDGKPSAAQRDAHQQVLQVLQYCEQNARPGASCRKLYHDAAKTLAATPGWSFPHHLGHGIGIFGHEAPRLNPDWDDYFQVGDVFTFEPGLYGDTPGGGVRLEQNYQVIDTGIKCLSHFSLDL